MRKGQCAGWQALSPGQKAQAFRLPRGVSPLPVAQGRPAGSTNGSGIPAAVPAAVRRLAPFLTDSSSLSKGLASLVLAKPLQAGCFFPFSMSGQNRPCPLSEVHTGVLLDRLLGWTSQRTQRASWVQSVKLYESPHAICACGMEATRQDPLHRRSWSGFNWDRSLGPVNERMQVPIQRADRDQPKRSDPPPQVTGCSPNSFFPVR